MLSTPVMGTVMVTGRRPVGTLCLLLILYQTQGVANSMTKGNAGSWVEGSGTSEALSWGVTTWSFGHAQASGPPFFSRYAWPRPSALPIT